MKPSEEYFVPNDVRVLHYPAVIFGNQTVTYGQLNDAVRRAVKLFQEEGITSNDRVAIVAANSLSHVLALLALWQMKAVACPLNIRLPDNALKDQCRQLNCSFLLTGINGLLNGQGIKKISLDRIGQNHVLSSEEKLHFSVDQAATIIFTSGSGAGPKAVLHTFGNHLYNARGANEHIPLRAGDRWLLSLPLYHVSGLGIIFRTILGGGSIVIPEANESPAQAINRYNITHLSLVSTQLIQLLQEPDDPAGPAKLKAVLIGGSAISHSLIVQAVNRRWPVYTSYGLTETASQVATSGRLTQDAPWPRGRILKYAQVRISDSQEILVRGPTLFQGYINPTATPGVVVGAAVDEEGWFHTVDLGRVNADGTLTVLGRKDNMFISGGENIQPEEIEEHLCRLEGVLQAVVVPVKSEEFGARPVAFVQFRENSQLDHNEIVCYLQKFLPRFKIPDWFFIWPKEEKENGLKINRQHLIKIVSEKSEINFRERKGL